VSIGEQTYNKQGVEEALKNIKEVKWKKYTVENVNGDIMEDITVPSIAGEQMNIPKRTQIKTRS